MINENGNLQIIDFGVAGLLESNQDKRSTIIGTGHWMPPEMHRAVPVEGLHYGFEVGQHY
jgi:serine/threonine protein kinase